MQWSLRHKIFETMRPDIYHGRRKKPPFFEGWYFKIVDSNEENAWAIIPGIYRDRDLTLDHAFVMVLDGRAPQVTYQRIDAADFQAAEETFHMRVGRNYFAADYLTLNLPEISGHLNFSGRTPWPISWRAPGIMGWYAWFPMECYHGVVSLDHALSGQLNYNGTLINFDGGRGYIEKDWGRNFPQTWIWIQANHFAQPGVSLSASIARIPFYGRVFPGFIIGLLVNGRLYRFTTYGGAKLKQVEVDGQQVTIVVNNDQAELTITAVQGNTVLLHAPTPGQGMIPRVKEGIDAVVRMQLSDLNGLTLFEGESRFAGMEIEGDTRILQTDQR